MIFCKEKKVVQRRSELKLMTTDGIEIDSVVNLPSNPPIKQLSIRGLCETFFINVFLSNDISNTCALVDNVFVFGENIYERLNT